jgi:hypothetical protein
MTSTLNQLVGSRWKGESELWLDPAGNEVQTSPCTIAIDDGVVRYTWQYQGQTHEGSYALRDGGADFTDTWHSPSAMACDNVDGWGLLEVAGTYAAGDGPPWGWQTTLSLRPTGELILQMTNVTPWGEHGRAVRMVCQRD